MLTNNSFLRIESQFSPNGLECKFPHNFHQEKVRHDPFLVQLRPRTWFLRWSFKRLNYFSWRRFKNDLQKIVQIVEVCWRRKRKCSVFGRLHRAMKGRNKRNHFFGFSETYRWYLPRKSEMPRTWQDSISRDTDIFHFSAVCIVFFPLAKNPLAVLLPHFINATQDCREWQWHDFWCDSTFLLRFSPWQVGSCQLIDSAVYLVFWLQCFVHNKLNLIPPHFSETCTGVTPVWL